MVHSLFDGLYGTAPDGQVDGQDQHVRGAMFPAPCRHLLQPGLPPRHEAQLPVADLGQVHGGSLADAGAGARDKDHLLFHNFAWFDLPGFLTLMYSMFNK